MNERGRSEYNTGRYELVRLLVSPYSKHGWSVIDCRVLCAIVFVLKGANQYSSIFVSFLKVDATFECE